MLVSNLKTPTRKGSILYNTSNGITTLRKYVFLDHLKNTKMFETEVNMPIKEEFKDNLLKKDLIYLVSQFLTFLLQNLLSKRMMCNKHSLSKTWFY
jgi:hypothetical protein